jgi:hypothetical protein
MLYKSDEPFLAAIASIQFKSDTVLQVWQEKTTGARLPKKNVR